MVATFARMDQAAQTVSDIIAAQVIPCTLEFLDRTTIRCVEDYAKIGLPPIEWAQFGYGGQDRQRSEAPHAGDVIQALDLGRQWLLFGEQRFDERFDLGDLFSIWASQGLKSLHKADSVPVSARGAFGHAEFKPLRPAGDQRGQFDLGGGARRCGAGRRDRRR